ncbi:MAG: TSUP family transporter [Gemmatimonadota bacterium]
MLGFELPDLLLFLSISLAICVTLCTLAMEASVLFTPAFLFLFPHIVGGFPSITPNEAIGLALVVEFFGYTSSVTGYWLRRQIDFSTAGRVLAVTVPLAVAGRLASYFVPGTGLLLLFGLILAGLAVVIYRSYRNDVRHTCLLCGDSLAGMRMDEGTVEGGGPSEASPSHAEAPAAPGTAAEAVWGPPGYRPRTHLWRGTAGGGIGLAALDRIIVGLGGALAGLVGIAIGEVTNTFLTVRKRVSVKMSTGTSALVLHLTILSALTTNLLVLAGGASVMRAERIVIPWGIGLLLAPVVIIGGQLGSFLNSRLSERTLLRLLTGAYLLVSIFVLWNSIRALLS